MSQATGVSHFGGVIHQWPAHARQNILNYIKFSDINIVGGQKRILVEFRI